MNLTDMRALVRRDLHDEDDADYRWTDDELDRQIARAVKELSEALPLEQKASLNTTGGSWEIQVGSLANRVTIDRVEYPVGRFPASCPRFSVWNEVLTLLDGDLPDGSQCHIYYGKLHTLDSSGSTIPAQYEDLVAGGACGYAAEQAAVDAVNRVNLGGDLTPGQWRTWGNEKLAFFRSELRRLGRRNRLRVRRLYIEEG
jgi:hypothetical protein